MKKGYIKEIENIIKKSGFEKDKEIYRGFYYSKDNLRNIIFSGRYKGKPAILKFYNDVRITDEPKSLENFLKHNKSKSLKAPSLYKKHIISPFSGWFIAEKIPNDFHNTKKTLSQKERGEFLEIFLEYRKNFPLRPERNLFLVEKLSADNFHIFRINRWLELAQKKEAESYFKNKKFILDKAFLNLYERALEKIKKEFKSREMIWCHGHFKPHEVFFNQEKTKYYLIDFAHTAMFPEGYELAFMAWADYLLASDKWDLPYSKWKVGAYEWISDLEILAKKLGFKNRRSLIRISMVERLLGTILADIVASDKPEILKRKGTNLMAKLLGELL